jgi:hypothetical protein
MKTKTEETAKAVSFLLLGRLLRKLISADSRRCRTAAKKKQPVKKLNGKIDENRRFFSPNRQGKFAFKRKSDEV